MVDEATSVNSVIADALKAAGVPERNIELPKGEASGQPNRPNPYNPDAPKGEVKGELPEEKQPSEAEKAKPPEAKSEEPKSGQPLTKTEIEASIAQAASRFQSIMDRRINQLQLQMQGTVNALNQFFQKQEETGLIGLSPEERTERRLQRLEGGGAQPKIQVQQSQQMPDNFTQYLYQYLTDIADVAGLKPDDKRLDWGSDLSVNQFTEIVSRFKVSVKNALVQDQAEAIKQLRAEGEKEISKVRKKTNVDKVSTSGPGGDGTPDANKLTPFEKIELGYKIQDQIAQQGQ